MLKKIFVFVLLTFFISCENSPRDLIQIKHEKGTTFISEEFVKEAMQLPQNVSLFTSQLSDAIAKKVRDKQVRLFQHYCKIYFSPWNERQKFKPQQSLSLLNFYQENNRIYSRISRARLLKNVKNSLYVDKKAIVVHDTVVKEFPTDSMLFKSIRTPGGSYPFDENILSAVRVGTPIRVISVSQDQQWNFVSCCYCQGWIKGKDIAYVGDDFAKKYQSLKLGICVKERTAIKDGKGFINLANIGTILPLRGHQILCPSKCSSGYAELIECDATNFKEMPVPFDAENVKNIAGQFLKQEYGWGGYLGHRDCSMLTMDFFSVFGIYLPRNSGAQLKSKRNEQLNSKNKRAKILANGIPWLTLVGKPGHVMIYVGKYRGNPVFFHNIYAFKRKFNLLDRFVIGETCLMQNFESQFFDNLSLLDISMIMSYVVPFD